MLLWYEELLEKYKRAKTPAVCHFISRRTGAYKQASQEFRAVDPLPFDTLEYFIYVVVSLGNESFEYFIYTTPKCQKRASISLLGFYFCSGWLQTNKLISQMWTNIPAVNCTLPWFEVGITKGTISYDILPESVVPISGWHGPSRVMEFRVMGSLPHPIRPQNLIKVGRRYSRTMLTKYNT